MKLLGWRPTRSKVVGGYEDRKRGKARERSAVRKEIDMGCYDFITGICPHCGGEFRAQTKLIGEEFVSYSVGDEVPIEDGRLRLKEPCEHCNQRLTMIVVDGCITGFDDCQPTDPQEGLYGAILASDDSTNDQFEREVMAHIRPKG